MVLRCARESSAIMSWKWYMTENHQGRFHASHLQTPPYERRFSQYSKIRNFLRFPHHKEELSAKIFRINFKRRAFQLLNTLRVFVGMKCSTGRPFANVLIRWVLSFGAHLSCCGCSQGAWELGSQREDKDLSVAWGLDGLLWLSPGGLGIRIPETGLGPLCSLGTWWFVVVVPRGPGN